MVLRKANSKWIVQTPAKLNVYLSVQGRRADGYHQLQTVMVPIRLFDTLIFEPLSGVDASPAGIRFRLIQPPVPRKTAPGNTVAGNTVADKTGHATAGRLPEPVSIPADDRNLVVRALAALRARTACDSRADVTLTKRIPAGTGLGGGSSDAAAALRTANLAWRLHLSEQELMDIAASLGSDVPFFLASRPAVCSGRGEIVAPLGRSVRLHAVVATPQERLESAEVYSAVRAGDFMPEEDAPTSRLNRVSKALVAGDVGTVIRLQHNALERAALSLRPGLARLQAAMQRWSTGAAMMTGSGSSMFCLCRTARHARRGAAYLSSLGYPTAVATASYG